MTSHPRGLCTGQGHIFGSVRSLRSDNVRLSVTVISCLEPRALNSSSFSLRSGLRSLKALLAYFVGQTEPKILCLACQDWLEQFLSLNSSSFSLRSVSGLS